MRAMLALIAVLGTGFAAYAAAPATPAVPTPPAAPVPLSITIYDQEDFKGRSVKITAATPNLAAYQFEDKVASFEVAGAGDWVLCADRSYKGVCARVAAKATDLRVIQLFGRVSSLYPVPAPTAPPMPTPMH
jgi:Beta/Gamma crystallin